METKIWTVIAGLFLWSGFASHGAPVENRDLTSDDLYVQRRKLISTITNAFASTSLTNSWPTGLPSIDQVATNQSLEIRQSLVAGLGSYAWRLEAGAEKRKYVISKVAPMLKDTGRVVRRILLHFQPEEFDKGAVEAVRDFFLKDENREKETILLAGMFDNDEVNKTIAGWASQKLKNDGPPYYMTRTWYALLVMARKGDKESIARLIRAADTERNLNMRMAVVMADFRYTRRPELAQYVAKYLDSKEVLPPENPHMKPESCAAYAVGLLARMLQDFPVESQYHLPTEDDIRKCKEWVAQQKEWKFRTKYLYGDW